MTGDHEWIPRADASQVAQRLRERRRAFGLTQVELAAAAHLAHATLVHWEGGRLPDTLAAATVIALEAALQVPQGWLLRHEMQPSPNPGGDAANALGRESGRAFLHTQIPLARCQELGPHARRLREELGMSAVEVARVCGVSRPTLLQWEAGTFPKALHAQRLRAWERALLLAPGQLLEPPASHPRMQDGQWRVVIEAETLEAAIHRVAVCLATRGRNLVGPDQPLDKAASRNAELLAHRYGIGAHRRWPLVDVAVSYGTARADVHKAVSRLIARAAQFAFEIPVLDSIVRAGGFASTNACADGRIRSLLGSSLSLECAATFAGEILARCLTDACPGTAACAGIPTDAAKAPLVGNVLPEAREPGLKMSQTTRAGLGRVAAEKRAADWRKENAEAIESSNAYVEQHGLPLETFRKF
jgi:transcriptional regulator with XRE-family HTH domain/post-segregation antitoxin (ccd killing protein)